MADIKERPVVGSQSSKTPLDTHLRDLRQRIFERGVETSAIPSKAVHYPPKKMPDAEVRFIPLHGSPLELLEQAGLQAAPLWMFIDSLPKRLDAVASMTFKKQFGDKPAFVFLGADGFLWIWHRTTSGCRIDSFPERVDADKVWVVGYKPA